MSLHRRLLILLAFFSCYGMLMSQGISWEQATPICDPNSTNTFIPLPAVEDYDKTMYPSSIEPCDSYFSFNLNNPAWYTLQATNTTISMDISITNCVGTGHGIGVQFALVEIIDGEPVPINCNSDANVGNGNSFTVSGLTPGRIYHLVLDGFAESVCEYSISNSSGFDDPSITESIDGIIVNNQPGSTSGCRVGGVVRVSAVNASNNPISNANIYEWEVTSIPVGGFSQNITNDGNDIALMNIPPGDYMVTVKASNACDQSQPTETFNFTVEPNNIIRLMEEEVCLDDLSDEFTPSDPNYIGDPLTGLPNNPTRDTFFVEIPGGNCPDIQLIPLDFIGGNNTPDRVVDTTTCDFAGITLNGQVYPPRAEGSSPRFVSTAGACSNTVELYVTQLFGEGDILDTKCNNGTSFLSFDPLIPTNFESVERYASYQWFNSAGDVVSTDPTYPVTQTDDYSLTITLQKGNNPPCIFDIAPIYIDASGVSELGIQCDEQTATSVSFRWNQVADAVNYVVAINGRTVDEDVRTESYTASGLATGEEVTITVFAIGSDRDCPPLEERISCEAMSCPDIEYQIENVATGNLDSLSICLDGNNEDPILFTLSGVLGDGTGDGRWRISRGGTLSGDIFQDNILFDPSINGDGEYVISYRYDESDCQFPAENVKFIEVIDPPISTRLRRRGRLDIEDGVCIGETLILDYNGNAGLNARAVWGGDISNADVVGTMPGPFDITFTTPGTKNFTFMVMDDNGCDSDIAPYSIEVGEPLVLSTVRCTSTAMGMEFDWDDQDCIEEYQLFINGRFEARVTESEYIYTRAVNGNSYELAVEAISGCGCGEIDFQNAVPCLHTFSSCEGVTVELSSNSDKFCIDFDLATLIQIDTLITGSTASGFGDWTVDTGNLAISDSGEFDPVVAGVGDHLIIYTWMEGACPFSDSLIISIADPVGIDFGISVADPLCFGETIGELNVNPVGGSGDYQVFIDEDPFGTFESSFELEAGSHTVIVIDTVSGCDTIALFDINPGPDSLSLFRDTRYIILDGGSFSISVDSVFVMMTDSIDWTFEGESVCDNPSCGIDFTYFPLMTGEICFNAYIENCDPYTECALLEYFPSFETYIPNVVSMANDSRPENQSFGIFTNDDLAVINLMLIYDRWGNIVYENRSEGSSMSWGPNSQRFSPGVYVYYIEITKGDGERVIETGDLTVIK